MGRRGGSERSAWLPGAGCLPDQIGSVAIGLRWAGLPPRMVGSRAYAGRSKPRPQLFGRTLTVRRTFRTKLGFVIAAPMRAPSVLVMMSVVPETLRGM